MKKSTFITAVFLISGILQAQQEFKESLNGITRIEITTETSVMVRKTSSNELSIIDGCNDCPKVAIPATVQEKQSREDDKAKGLTAIYAKGKDNTGVGMSIEKDGEVLRIKDLKKFYSRQGISISLPSSISLSLDCGKLGSATIEDLDSELEITTTLGNIRLNNVTGPVTAYSAMGTIEAIFSNVSQKGPISISSSTGNIDIGLPADTKSSVDMDSKMGMVYTDFDLTQIIRDGIENAKGQRLIQGKLNGGGVKFILKTSTGNIYLRKI